MDNWGFSMSFVYLKGVVGNASVKQNTPPTLPGDKVMGYSAGKQVLLNQKPPPGCER